MPSFTLAYVDCAPGNTVTLAGSDLTGVSAMLGAQGVDGPGTMIGAIAIGVTVASDGNSLTFVVPDGVTNGPLVAARDGTLAVATCNLIVASQYVQAVQYRLSVAGTADAVSGLEAGDLDDVLRDASALIDSVAGTTLRLLQVAEDHPFRQSRDGRVLVWPLRGPMRSLPIVSVDGLGSAFGSYAVASNAVWFDVTGGYVAVRPLAAGAVEMWRIVYTAGFGWMQTPRALRKATALIATAMLVEAGVIQEVGGMMRVREGDVQYARGTAADIDMPNTARALLRPWIGGGIR